MTGVAVLAAQHRFSTNEVEGGGRRVEGGGRRGSVQFNSLGGWLMVKTQTSQTLRLSMKDMDKELQDGREDQSGCGPSAVCLRLFRESATKARNVEMPAQKCLSSACCPESAPEYRQIFITLSACARAGAVAASARNFDNLLLEKIRQSTRALARHFAAIWKARL